MERWFREFRSRSKFGELCECMRLKANERCASSLRTVTNCTMDFDVSKCRGTLKNVF